MHRNASIQKIQSDTFDLCIIGGGASGAGCALDAALRGLKVVLIEKNDFASGTSSKSTKLIHGGVRYLEQAFKNLDFAQLRQVQHGLAERHTLLANAPHLARPITLATPVFSWLEGLYFRIGLWIYDQIASRKDTLPPSRWLSRKAARQLLPGLTNRLHSAVCYADGQLDDARYCLALAQTAAEAGATMLNYAEVFHFEKNNQGQITAAVFTDRLNPGRQYRILASCFLNCTGPQADLIRLLANPALPQRIRPSKGVHLMLPLSVLGSSNTALLIPKTPDGRVVFAVPFEGKLMLGTTDQDYPNPEQEPHLEAAEVNFLLKTLQPYLQAPIDQTTVSSGFGGLRPLVISKDRHLSKSTKKLLRDHEVEFDPESGLFSLLGGKWTTYRLMASDTLDAICEHLGVKAPCTTEQQGLAGSEHFSPLVAIHLQEHSRLPEDVATHLAHNYGSRATQVAELANADPKLGQRLHPAYPFICAEVPYAARNEMACTLRDMLARRIRLELLDWEATLQSIPTVAELMAEALGWTAAEKAQQVDDYANMIREFMAASGVRDGQG
ncbi:MAG: FAD-dependent oxidoreductase [Lewinellaceae bacterium]|nr:FAD-dependent oxidoreductase [Lewinellaceae bacterium]